MNVSGVRNCYGCGVCSIICTKKIINIILNKDGFYEPKIIDSAKCTDCGLCASVCSYLHDDLSLKDISLKCYAAWSNDASIHRKCTSGGVGFEVGRTLISRGYKVCGVRYNIHTNRAEHYIAGTVEELVPSIGSKYIQSYTVDGFKKIDRKGRYLVTGTPCQIDSFRRYIQKFRCEDNFVLMDFFCHGVPSMLLWQKYLQSVEKITGKTTYVSWRNKFTGLKDSINAEKVNWHDSYNILISGEKGYYNSRLSKGDVFYRLFLSDSCLGKACYDKCKFKYNQSSADIRIGDLWGKTYQDNEDGVSAAIAFTKKGNDVLTQCNCTFVEHSFDIVAERQMKHLPNKNLLYVFVMRCLRKRNSSIASVVSVLVNYYRTRRLFNRLSHPCKFH